MSQQEVYQLLEGHPEKRFTSKDVGKMLGVTTSSANESLRGLHRRGDVIRQGIGKGGKPFKYKFKEQGVKR